MTMGRPKAEKVKEKYLNMRLTNEEFEEICKVAEKLKISKTEAVMRGIKLLKNPPRQIITRSQLPNFKPKKIPKYSEGIIDDGEVIMYDKK